MSPKYMACNFSTPFSTFPDLAIALSLSLERVADVMDL